MRCTNLASLCQQLLPQELREPRLHTRRETDVIRHGHAVGGRRTVLDNGSHIQFLQPLDLEQVLQPPHAFHISERSEICRRPSRDAVPAARTWPTSYDAEFHAPEVDVGACGCEVAHARIPLGAVKLFVVGQSFLDKPYAPDAAAAEGCEVVKEGVHCLHVGIKVECIRAIQELCRFGMDLLVSSQNTQILLDPGSIQAVVGCSHTPCSKSIRADHVCASHMSVSRASWPITLFVLSALDRPDE